MHVCVFVEHGFHEQDAFRQHLDCGSALFCSNDNPISSIGDAQMLYKHSQMLLFHIVWVITNKIN